MNDKLYTVGLMVYLEKLAFTKGIGSATSAVGQAVRKAIGKGMIRTPIGLAAQGTIKASPYIATAYGVNAALDNPVGKELAAQKRRYKARMLDRRAVYNPQTGVMY
jgi:hypothetical protein